ncbi:MAG: hypothetical protein PHS49_03285 [Candidatus Gracilibacteria bacterium]|nr:hypothetical protein [Candidatus Gracilibacteria bacterium]
MPISDKPQYEGIYSDEGTTEKLYISRLNDFLNKRGESNIKDIFDILDDAKKTKNTKLIEEMYSIIANNLENNTKILDVLKIRLNECNLLLKTLDRLDMARKKDRGVRKTIISFNNLDIDKLKNSSMTNKVFNFLGNNELDINVFDVNNTNSPFNYLINLRKDLFQDFEGIKKYSKDNNGTINRFKSLFN